MSYICTHILREGNYVADSLARHGHRFWMLNGGMNPPSSFTISLLAC